MAEYTTSSFVLNQAKMGISVGYVADNKVILATYISFENDRFFEGFVSFGDNKKYGFIKSGKVFNGDGEIFAQLVMVSTTITQTQGTAGTRADGTTTIDVTSLQPREEVAMHCLETMLAEYDNPLNFDNTKIKQLVSKSFLFAQEFINQAVEYRKKETTSSTTTGTTTGTSASTTTTDTSGTTTTT